MTKLIIQIPCFNEAETLPETLARLPRSIPGIETIEMLVIDDGSADDTAQVAARWGVQHVVRHRRNRGLAAAFQSGLDAALAAGADVIVNTDGDGQYAGEDIGKLVAPVLAGEADIVVGDRGVGANPHFSPFKRRLQRIGSRVVQWLARAEVTDAVSGFRAVSRHAAQRISITAEFSYTTDMLIQAGRKKMKIISVPIGTNAVTRPSRLFKSIPQFVMRTLVTMVRAYATYNPLRTFFTLGALAAFIGTVPILRFLWFWLQGDGGGHVQSLILGAALLLLGVLTGMMGLLADLIGANRKLLEMTLERVRRLEDEVGHDSGSTPANQDQPGRPVRRKNAA